MARGRLGLWNGAAGAIIAAIIGVVFVYFRSTPKNIPTPRVYSEIIGTVHDRTTNDPIGNAHVTCASQGIPTIATTDSDGTFKCKIDAGQTGARVRIEAPAYDTLEQWLPVQDHAPVPLLLNRKQHLLPSPTRRSTQLHAPSPANATENELLSRIRAAVTALANVDQLTWRDHARYDGEVSCSAGPKYLMSIIERLNTPSATGDQSTRKDFATIIGDLPPTTTLNRPALLRINRELAQLYTGLRRTDAVSAIMTCAQFSAVRQKIESRLAALLEEVAPKMP